LEVEWREIEAAYALIRNLEDGRREELPSLAINRTAKGSPPPE
jgi:hypothetical protein